MASIVELVKEEKANPPNDGVRQGECTHVMMIVGENSLDNVGAVYVV